MAYGPETITALLDNLMTCSMAEAARRVGISSSLPFKWMARSKLGDAEFQNILWCEISAPLHVHVQNAKALMSHQIEMSALERARDGVYVDVFFQGQRQYESVLKPEFAGMNEDTLCIEIGPDFKTICYEKKPTKQWLKPSDALVLKLLESWNRKRYGSHQQIDVNYGGVLRLERPDEPATKVIDSTFTEVFEAGGADAAEQGGRLALARPAKDSAELDKWNEAGEFQPAPVTFVNAAGERTELRADLERRLEAAKQKGPAHVQPSHRVQVFKPDDTDKAVVREDEPPEPQSLADHPRAYTVDKLTPYNPPKHHYSKDEAAIGTGREGIGEGPDPRKLGPHVGFPVR